MAKKILNMSLFEEKLNNVLVPLEEVQTGNSIGLSNVIRYVWNHYPTSAVDFDSFDLEDVYEAKSYIYGISEDGTEEEEEEHEPTFNPWVEIYMVENVISALYHGKKVVYENDDDFI